MITTIVLFILCIFFIFYLPGKFILRIARFDLQDRAITTASSLSIGICLFLLVTYLFSWIGVSIMGDILMFLLSIIEIIYIYREKKNIKIGKNIISIELLIIFMGSYFMAYLMWWSGMLVNGDLVFYSTNATDALYHLSLIGGLMHHFPPIHPGLDGVSFRGYHFFYDLMLANFSKAFGFSILDLYLRLFPFFIAFFYGLSGLALVKFLKIGTLPTRIFIFSLYFSQGFGFAVTEYFHIEYTTGIVQSIAHIADPNVIFSVGMLFVLFIFIFKSKSILQIILSAIIIGLLPNIKIYTAVIVFGGLFATSVVALLRNKNTIYFKILFLAGVIGGIVYMPINYGVGKLIFAPFLLYRHFMESAFVFSKFQWEYKYQYYSFHENYLRLIYLLLIAIFLFFLPSLGFRIASILYLPRLLKKTFYTSQHIFWLVGISIAFLIPTFFIQETAVFVIIQFLWLGYILLLLPTSVVFGELLKKAHILIIILFFGLFALVSVPDIFTAIKTFTKSPTIISKDMVHMTNFIQEKVPQEKRVLVLNRDERPGSDDFTDLYTVPIVSALSEHAVYYEPEVLDFKAIMSIIAERKNVIDTMQKITYTCDNVSVANEKITTFMRHTNNQYILIFKNTSCLDKLQNFMKIHADGELGLYRLL